MRDSISLTLALPADARLEPAGLSWLAAGIARREFDGLRTTFEGNHESSGFRDLERIGFFRVLELKTATRPSTSNEPTELRRIETEVIAEQVARETTTRLVNQLESLPTSVGRLAKLILEELGVNIVQHSGAPRTGFGFAEASTDKRRFRISFCDAGVGFLASLQRSAEFNGRIDDESVALQLALKEGVSFSDSRANMGWGLGLVRTFADQLDATLWIASGEALLLRRRVAGQRVSTLHGTSGWRGAWVCIDAPLPTSREFLSS